MPWTPAQLEAVFANVYANILTCPGCGGRLGLTQSAEIEGIGLAECAACGDRRVISPANDPARSRFREYTEQERKEIIAADNVRRTPVCPIDGTGMEVNAQRSLALNSNVLVRCRRCRGEVTFKRKHG
ncbi:MAG TPA: hypothetical protein VFE58_10470 [Tepidisphaeraceae bacterium]|jgi:uncharacterized protein YbaR (Trm112 family)|nr:hypothetical protein [Tepidisphaeraceae bacterium]